MSKFTRRMRQRRDARAFDAILRNASPSMQHELMAIASRTQGGVR
jgi:hypothetical protein